VGFVYDDFRHGSSIIGGVILALALFVFFASRRNSQADVQASEGVNLSLLWGFFAIGIILAGFATGVEIGIALILLMLSFLLATWPRADAEMAAPWVLLLCALVGNGLFALIHRPWTGAVSGILWFMASMVICNYRTHWLESKSDAPRLLIGLIAWPATLMRLARNQAPAPIIAACLLTLALTPANRLYLLLPVWLFCTLTILGLESVFTTNVRERRR
jgi:hypothetical protein